MNYQVIDFETRSPVDISDCGGYAYAMHPDTEITMLSIMGREDTQGRVWIAPKFRHLVETDLSTEELKDIISEADAFVAHNAPFERMMWRYKMTAFGFDDIPLEKMHCTAARAAMCGFPRKLENGVKYWTNGSVEKDTVGHRLMLKLSQPRKFLKRELEDFSNRKGITVELIKQRQEEVYAILNKGNIPKLGYDYLEYLVYHEKPTEYERFKEYCRQDVVAEKALLTLPKLPPTERKLWEFDQRINDRGVEIDRESCLDIVKAINKFDDILKHEALSIANYQVTSMRAPASILAWLASKGVHLSSTNKESISEALKGDIPDDVRRFLEIRQVLAKSAVAKYDAMLRTSTVDGRSRGCFTYHGASTGRWTGNLFQPQNLPRTSGKNMVKEFNVFDEYEIHEYDIQLLRSGNMNNINLFWNDVKVLASDCLRPMIIPRKGNEFICADFSAIEGRGLAWFADEFEILEGYKKNLDMYKVAASGIYRIPYEQVDGGGKGPQRQIGKVAELALGYGGGVGAMLAFGANKLAPPLEEMKEMFPLNANDKFIQEEELINLWLGGIIKSWRDSRVKTKLFWYGLVNASVRAMKSGKREYYGKVSFLRQGRFLTMLLPSGRNLWYPDARLEEVTMSWEDKRTGLPAKKDIVTAMTVDGTTKQFVRRPLNHLILSENATQALCRDLLVEAMFRVEEAGYPVVMHVHDEILCEVPKGYGSLKEFEELMSVVPPWAEGFPIKAVGWRGFRYKK